MYRRRRAFFRSYGIRRVVRQILSFNCITFSETLSQKTPPGNAVIISVVRTCRSYSVVTYQKNYSGRLTKVLSVQMKTREGCFCKCYSHQNKSKANMLEVEQKQNVVEKFVQKHRWFFYWIQTGQPLNCKETKYTEFSSLLRFNVSSVLWGT